MEDREYKIRFVAKKIAEGQWSRHTIQSIGISRRTYFTWKRVIEEQGIEALLNRAKQRRQEHCATDTPMAKAIGTTQGQTAR